MIEINLLPEQLKLKKKKATRLIKSRQSLYFIYLVFGILIMMHIYLVGVVITKNLALSVLSNRWQRLQSQRKLAEDFKRESKGLFQEAKIMRQLTSQKIIWSENLNKLSLNLPTGVWFNEIQINPKKFTLKASVVSLQEQEMSLINRFMDNLKNDKDFFGDFNNLELSSVQRRIISGYDIADFVLVGTLNSHR